MMTSEVKATLIKCLIELVGEHQKKRAQVTDEDVRKFMEIRPLKFKNNL